LIALKDYNGNNLFDPQRKNRFHKKNISIPNDTLYELELFRDLAFKASKPVQASGNKAFGIRR
jgi:hypothetical protein